ncbi:MAG TPA: DoxX family protein [Bacteroidales bacterium]|jgi:uncharacterized membrane protein YphA (DoxX/SURF4 family)|nr:DoxX family protein [Bacteroidales bacterium]
MSDSRVKVVGSLVEFTRLLVGATFLFSGFVKAIDPSGFAYKIEDYLIAFQLVELFPLAQPAALLMVVAEFALGVMLLLGVYRKWTLRLIGLFMLFYTPLTLWIALTNPVEDCGCFGDAFIISNWQTFYKNLLLLLGTLFLLLNWRKIKPLFSSESAPLATIFTIAFGFFFSLYNLFHYPIMDFRPYHVGANIPAQMQVDPEKGDLLETIFIYSKEGVEQEFTEENLPWDDSTWTYVDARTRVVREGENPAIEDFALAPIYREDADGEWYVGGDVTDLILSEPSYQLLMIAYSLEGVREGRLDRFIAARDYAEAHDYPFYLFTASSPQEVGNWEGQHQTCFQFIQADERELKTMIRSQPGLILLKGGVIINKWGYHGVPRFNEVNASLEDSRLASPPDRKRAEAGRLGITALLFLVPLLLLKGREQRLLKH